MRCLWPIFLGALVGFSIPPLVRGTEFDFLHWFVVGFCGLALSLAASLWMGERFRRRSE